MLELRLTAGNPAPIHAANSKRTPLHSTGNRPGLKSIKYTYQSTLLKVNSPKSRMWLSQETSFRASSKTLRNLMHSSKTRNISRGRWYFPPESTKYTAFTGLQILSGGCTLDTLRWGSLPCPSISLFDDGYLYLLGRTPATYILRRYHVAPTMLITCTDDTFLDLGEPLAQYESPPLPDPGIPWGSCDFQIVHLEPSSHLSVLMLRSWYREGQYLRFPLSSGTQPTVIRLEPDTHLLPNANLYPRWMGREQAMIFSDDDDDLDKNALFRPSFPHSDSEDVSKDRSPSEASADVIATGRVRREDLLTGAAEWETRVLTRASVISVDEQSGRVCVLLTNGEGLIISSPEYIGPGKSGMSGSTG